ncbi:MAG: ABC transporter ATP-binding protein [Lachnospiraceae bacterium]|nr:ABC transporter ATP-binding protein [Lachnospiraceae bacterium]
MEREIVVDVKDVSKIYESQSGRRRVLDRVNISIRQGEFVGIVGDSGSGKTTLLNLVGGMDCVSEGTITVAGDAISDYDDKQRTLYRRGRVGFIFQDYNLINELTVYENIILPFQLKGKEINEKFIDEFLDMLKLKEKKNAFPMQLSGGEQQRAAVLRSLLSEPDIILADEPTGNLDSRNTQVVVKLLKHFSERMNKTILFVTHNMELTKSCNRVIKVKDGKIVGG